MKCPIKLTPATAKFVKDNNLVYVGVGNPCNNLLAKDGTIFCSSLRVLPSGAGWDANKIDRYFGGIKDNHYFVSRSDARKHFPHCLPKAREPRPKTIYYRPKDGDTRWTAKLCGFVDHVYRSNGAYESNGSETATGFSIGARGNIEGGLYKTITRSQFLARIKACGLKEDGTKIVPVKTEVETLREENSALKARIVELRNKVNRLDGAIRTAAMSL